MANGYSHDSIAIANADLRAAEALRDDLLAMLFPRGENLPSEFLQSATRVKLQALVQGIERRLTGNEGPPESWNALATSGLLREPSLVNFALARLAEGKLKSCLASGGAAQALVQLPVTLLNHDNPRIAAMAQQLLYAEQQMSSSDRDLFLCLPSADLHQLCWRVVAALSDPDRAVVQDLSTRAAELLAAHDSGKNASAIARKLVFFLGPEYRADLIDPRKAGIQLFIAALAQDYRLDSDFLFNIVGGESPAALLLLLKAQGLPVEQLPSLLVALRGDRDASPELADVYGNIDPVEARAAIAAWAEDGQ